MRALVEERDLELVRAVAGQISECLDGYRHVLEVLADAETMWYGDTAQRAASPAEATHLLEGFASEVAVFDADGRAETNLLASVD